MAVDGGEWGPAKRTAQRRTAGLGWAARHCPGGVTRKQHGPGRRSAEAEGRRGRRAQRGAGGGGRRGSGWRRTRRDSGRGGEGGKDGAPAARVSGRGWEWCWGSVGHGGRGVRVDVEGAGAEEQG